MEGREHGPKPATFYRWCNKLLGGEAEPLQLIPVHVANVVAERYAMELRLVMDVLESDPLSGGLFVFYNPVGDKLKVLY